MAKKGKRAYKDLELSGTVFSELNHFVFKMPFEILENYRVHTRTPSFLDGLTPC